MIGINRSGFTLIELMVVIAVGSIMAAVVLIAIDPVEKFANANDADRKSDLGQVASAMSTYYFSNGASYAGLSMAGLVNSRHLKNALTDVTIEVDGSGATAIAYVRLTSQKETCPSGQSGTKYWTYHTSTGEFVLTCSGTSPTP
ncbi:prepilin-type N-terminal cleavage/methylation domain-containing protein [candidate division WWE3 bacterium]|nr:prepilin-type N-terminal cleavage/methylation domain-containing protein [candidate division WWE3 bacterium]